MRRLIIIVLGAGVLLRCSLLFTFQGYEGTDAANEGGTLDCDGAIFCDDFDNPNRASVQDKWTRLNGPSSTLGGTIEISDANAVSPPSAFHVKLPAEAPDASNYGTLSLDVTTPASGTLTVDYDWLLIYDPTSYGTNDYGNSFEIATFATYQGATGFGNVPNMTFAYYPRLLDGGNAPVQTVHFLGNLTGAWHHFHVEMTFRQAGRMFVAVDGVTAFEDTNVALCGATIPTTVTLTFGVVLTRQTGVTETFYDNVVIH